jgi:hypothetical protein
MAQFYTLEEAARVLGMSPEDLKAEAQQRKVRAFLDGGTWRFRVGDVDELARRRGMGSDAELRLSDLELPVSTNEEPVEIDISEFQLDAVDSDSVSLPTMPISQSGTPADSATDHDVMVDDLSLPPNATASSSVIIGMQTTGGRMPMPSDSDVRLIPDNTAGPGSRASDSDVRLSPAEFQMPSDSGIQTAGKSKLPGDSDVTLRQPSDSDVTLIAGDTSEHQSVIIPQGLGDTAVRPSPLSGSSEDVVPSLEQDSDFDLTPSSIEEAIQPESGSDFELTALEGSDEFEATPMVGPSDSDVTAADPGFSGINLSRPSDSGINLQMASGLGIGGADSIELAPLSGSSIKPVPAAKPKPSLAKTPPPPPRTPGAKPEKDIFDDTDFEVDALDSGQDLDDRTMQLEAQSDFELEDADTGSEVFAIDEEDVDQNAATALGPGVASASGDEEEEAGDLGTDWDTGDSVAPVATPSGRVATVAPVIAGAGATAEWGGLWVGILGVTTLFMLFLAFVSIDLVRNLYDFRGDSPASGIVSSLAGLIAGG